MYELFHSACIVMLLAIACEAITEIIGASLLFEKVREKIIALDICFISDLLACKYCLSVWVSVVVAGSYCMVEHRSLSLFNSFNLFIILKFMLIIIVVHRLSNWLHLLFDIIQEYRQCRWSITIPAPGND